MIEAGTTREARPGRYPGSGAASWMAVGACREGGLARSSPPRMLELRDVTVTVGPAGREQTLLQGVSAAFPRRHFGAIIGPSGCGKTTLLKVVAGLIEPSEGVVRWEGRDLAEDGDLAPSELGYVPQFSIAHGHLTVAESVRSAMRLRVAGWDARDRETRLGRILEQTGLAEIADRRVRHLSGGQQRRLGLALEIVSDPVVLLCDEVTSGLDPKSEDDVVGLMARLAEESDRTVLHVTHSLRHLDRYGSVTLLHEGHVAYHGPGAAMLEYFGTADSEAVFPRLAERTGADWHLLRKADAGIAYGGGEAGERGEGAEAGWEGNSGGEEGGAGSGGPWGEGASEDEQEAGAGGESAARRTPGLWVQWLELTARRWRLFFRQGSQVWLQALLVAAFPCLVVLFAYRGLPDIRHLSMEGDIGVLERLRETVRFGPQRSRVGGLVSGLVMFQVILLALMGSNNAAREIVAERPLLEKEKLGGLRPGAYLASKAAFLVVLVGVQSVWMAWFVKFVCRFPGGLLEQAELLFLANAAVTAVCLGISSWARTTEESSLVSVYLVGFQLPLSGVILALPETVGHAVRPFIAAYWGWSGVLQTMKQTDFYDLAVRVAETPVAIGGLCRWVLVSHVVIGLMAAYTGCLRSQWGRG